MHTNWLDGTETWIEILKRVLQYNFRDLRTCLELAVDQSELEFPDLLGCSLAAARASNYPKLFSAIEKEMGLCTEKTAAMRAVSDAAMQSTWNFYKDTELFSEVDRLDINGGTNLVKYTMYLLSAYLVFGDKRQIDKCIEILKSHVTESQIDSIVRLVAVIKAVSLAQV